MTSKKQRIFTESVDLVRTDRVGHRKLVQEIESWSLNNLVVCVKVWGLNTEENWYAILG